MEISKAHVADSFFEPDWFPSWLSIFTFIGCPVLKYCTFCFVWRGGKTLMDNFKNISFVKLIVFYLFPGNGS